MVNAIYGVAGSLDPGWSTGKRVKDPSLPAQQQEDEVKVSIAARVQALNDQGQSVNQIANTLGLTVKEVKAYLDLTKEILKAALAAALAAK
jgi:DNA-binding NarL/FixJ family response regulator